MTLALLFVQPYLPERILELTHNPSAGFSSYSDEAEVGGKSVHATIHGPQPSLRCDIKAGAAFRYCGGFMQLHSQPVNYGDQDTSVLATLPAQLMDLTDYSYIELKIDYEGDYDQITLSMLNLSDIPDDDGQLRELTQYMDVTLQRSEFDSTIHIYFDEFLTSQWWLAEYHVPRMYSRLRSDRVTGFVIGFMDTPAIGKGAIKVERLILHGELISRELLSSLIIIYWLVFVAAEAAFQFARINRQRKQAKQSLNALQKDFNDLTLTASRDSLTGAFNRVNFNTLRKTFFERYPNNAYVFVLDLDFFKTINDTYGHHIGDSVLQKTAKAMMMQVRDSDVFVRWGGEEFVLLAANLSHSKALELAERLRESVGNLELRAGELSIVVSVSVGVAPISYNASFVDVFNRADKALYSAKQQGRNRVVFDDGSLPGRG